MYDFTLNKYNHIIIRIFRLEPLKLLKKELPMKMEKRKFRIGELAQHLNVERFVIRFWEKEFNFKSHRSYGGQRFYDEQDLKQFKAIKELLYEKKFTIAGAKQALNQKKVNPISSITASHKTTIEQEGSPVKNNNHKDIYKKLVHIKKALLDLKKIL